MKVAYVAGPYNADSIYDTVLNIRRAEVVALSLWKMGFAVVCPHKNTSLLDGACSRKTWIDGDLEILTRCDLLVVLPDWENSEGTKDEITQAYNVGIPTFYWPNDKQKLRALV